MWLNLERSYGEAKARQASQAELRRQVDWVDRFPIADLVKHDQLPRTKDKFVLLDALLRFLGASSPDAWQRQWESVAIALRRSGAFEPQPEALSSWLRWGELEASHLSGSAQAFDAERLSALLPKLRSFTRLDPIAFQQPLQEELARAGVLILFIPEISGSRISGAARWLDNETAAIQLSLRHKRDDQFWFAVFHEIGHILEGLRRQTYVDLVAPPGSDADEMRADAFARNARIEQSAYDSFVAGGQFESAEISAFARRLGVGPGLVVGRLQHDGHLQPQRLNHLKRALNWA